MLTTTALTQIVGVYELPPIATADDHVFGPVQLTLQICRLPSGRFSPRVLRKERIYAVPAYYEHREGLAQKITVEIDVLDDTVEWALLESTSEAEALEQALAKLSDIFYVR